MCSFTNLTIAPAATASPATDHFTANASFFASISLTSPDLHHVHTLAISVLPRDAVPAVDAPLHSFLTHTLRNLDHDPPVLAIYATPRLLLAPPPSSLTRRELVPLIRRRSEDLRLGRAAELWDAFDWLAALPSPTDFPETSAARSSARITSSAASRSPASGFRSIADPPYLPPTAAASRLLLSLIPTDTNPDLAPDQLPAEAAAHLPSSPLGSGFIHDPTTRADTIAAWRRHLTRYPGGAPDGTGLTDSLLLACTDSFHLAAQWLDSLTYSRTTPAHRALLSSKTLGGKVKPDKRTRQLPSTAADATAARPLARHPITRRLIAGFLARRITPILRPIYTRLHQFGLVRAGLEAAPRRHQLHHDLHPPSFTSAALDIENAHTTVSLLACYLLIALLARDTPLQPLLHRFRFYTLSYYHAARATYIQSGSSFIVVWQTDGLDQGEALASHIFGYAIAYIIHHRLRPSVPSLITTLIHDDLTLSDFPLSSLATHPPPSTPSVPAAPDATTPLPRAIALFRTLALSILRCVLAERKTTLYQPLPPTDPASVVHFLHLFPAGTTVTHTHFILGGCPVGSPEALPIALAAELDRYTTLLTRLAELPALSSQISLLILTLSCRP